jgi:hypothetical protein
MVDANGFANEVVSNEVVLTRSCDSGCRIRAVTLYHGELRGGHHAAEDQLGESGRDLAM